MAKRSTADATAAAEPATTIEPQAAPPTSSTSSSPSSTATATTKANPLDVEHYIPRLPLQLVAITFALLAPVAKGAKTLPRPAQFLETLIASPLETLSFACALLAVVQVWFGYWARSCRLKAGTGAGGAKLTVQERVERSRAAARRTAPKGFKAIVTQIWNNDIRGLSAESIVRGGEHAKRSIGGMDHSFAPETILVTLLATAAFHASAVLLGASFIANAALTFLLSLMLALLAITPLAIAYPPFQSPADGYVWLRLLSTHSPANDLEFALFAPAVGAVIGCWAGALPIPLDWDRPWQKYPTTSILGAVAGHALGSVLSLLTVSYRAAVRAATRALNDVKQRESEEEEALRVKSGKGLKTSKGKGAVGKIKSR
ncbi:hypothetical protein JCM10908_005477 [Rhodotorula pacifica]|uniref:mannose-ethanolamine phosphotransferase GPI11 n=1 Tax=Rhodotorula pacifica TaxID=1495444 RepID=UPI00317E7A0E